MRKAVLVALALLAALLVAIPVSFAATFLLWPLWSWAERELSVEAVGHSAPAEWCFIATYAVLAVAALGVIAWRTNLRREQTVEAD